MGPWGDALTSGLECLRGDALTSGLEWAPGVMHLHLDLSV